MAANRLPAKADHVGSFLRPERIKQARKKLKNGAIDEAELNRIENEEIESLVQKQIDLGLKSITDGELRRAFWHYDFFVGLDGIDWTESERKEIFGSGNKPKMPTIEITGQIKYKDHYMIEHFTFLKKMVDKHGDGTQVAKFAIPAPSVIMYRAVNEKEMEVYPDAVDIFQDLAVAYQKVVQTLYDAGCRYIQFDDTTLAAFYDSTFINRVTATTGLNKKGIIELIVRTTNEALKDRPEDLLVTVHMCRGNFRSQHLHTDGGYDLVAPYFDELPYDAFFLEYDDERSGDFEPLKHMKRKDVEVVLGLVTSKFSELENPDTLEQRMEEAAQYIPLENLAISPQCGFASSEDGNKLTEEEQWNKIRHVIEIADRVWGQVPVQ